MDYETLATAFMLLYGPPPKSLRYRTGGMWKSNAKAQAYASLVEKYIREQHPHATRTRTLLARRRNDVLRAIFRQLGIEPSR